MSTLPTTAPLSGIVISPEDVRGVVPSPRAPARREVIGALDRHGQAFIALFPPVLLRATPRAAAEGVWPPAPTVSASGCVPENSDRNVR